MGVEVENNSYVNLFVFYGNSLPYVVEVDYNGYLPKRIQDKVFQQFLRDTTGSEVYEYTDTNPITASICIKKWLYDNRIDNVAFDTKECHDNFYYFKKHFLENCDLARDKKGKVYEISWKLN